MSVSEDSTRGTLPGVGGRGTSWRGQALLLVAAWLVACGLFWTNDGLWFQGDAPRHALNGLFYRDFATEGWRDPQGYAEQYYARYPAICPTYYPPLFYLLEAAVYAVVGPQWWVGKALSMVTGLVAGGYMLAWLRRWVSESSGWLAGLLVWMPGMAEWMNAAMLNVPASALGLGALYHLRRAMEMEDRREEGREVSWAFALAAGGILTHPVAAVVVVIGLAWILTLRRWTILGNLRVWVAVFLVALAIVPVFYVLYRFGDRLDQVLQTKINWSPTDKIWFYPKSLFRLCGAVALLAAGFGAMVGLWSRRWRREVVLVAVWLGVFYLAMTFIWAKSARYALVLCPATVVLVAILLEVTRERARRVVSERQAWWLASGISSAIALSMLMTLLRIPSQDVSIIREVADYMKQIAPREPVFYRGRHDGVFTFYLRLDDLGRERQVVPVASWLQEKMGPVPQPFVVDDRSLEFTRKSMLESGVRWLIQDRPVIAGQSVTSPTQPNVRGLTARPGFRLVRTFQNERPPYIRFEVYQLSDQESSATAAAETAGTGVGAVGAERPSTQTPPSAVPRKVFGHLVHPLAPPF